MKLKKKVNDLILTITFLIILFLGFINDIKGLTGYIIYGVLILILAINTIIIFKYGRDD